MNIPVVIDVMIGLVLVYCLLSTIASTLVEMVSLRRRWRNAVLRRTVERLLVGENHAVQVSLSGKNRDLLVARSSEEAGGILQSGRRLQEFWDHPVISRLRAPGTDAPAYMSGERFASAVIDIATGQGKLGVVPNTIPALHHAIEGETEGEMERALLALLRGVSPLDPDPRARLLEAVARWYDEAMERSSVTYRKKVQGALFWLGLAVAVLLNVDTVRMISVLSTDADLRTRMVEYAVKLEDRQAAAAAATSGTAPTAPATPPATVTAAPAPASVSREQLREQVRGLRDLAGEGFPLGWVAPFAENFSPVHPTGGGSWVLAFFTKIVGCLVTAFAICLGAPFWFDLLHRLLKLRAARTAESEKAGATAAAAAAGPSPSGSPAPRSDVFASSGFQGDAASGAGGAPVAGPATLRLPFDEELRLPGTAFSQARAAWLAEAADLSYQPEAELRRLAHESWGAVELRPICNKETDTECFLILGTGVAVLAFRGTEPTHLKDIVTDLNAAPVQLAPYPGRVHRGFADALESIWPLLLERVRSLQGSGRLLHVTGHSLGGALATLAAFRLQKERLYPVQTLYTYGSPRAGDSDFALAFDAMLGARCHRVVNNEDLVTRVPTRSMGYKHIGQIAYIDERGVLRFDVGYWYRFLNLVANASASLEVAAKTSFRDHSMTLYRQHLDKGLV